MVSRFPKYLIKKEKESCGYLLRITHLDNDNEESFYEASLKAEKTMNKKESTETITAPVEEQVTVSFQNPLISIFILFLFYFYFNYFYFILSLILIIILILFHFKNFFLFYWF